jgi:hypothetical protein
MNAVEYLKIKGRMTENCEIDCDECPLECVNNKENINCVKFETDFTEQAIGIVEKWAKEHPIKTYLSVLLERLPNIQFECDGTPNFCPTQVFKIKFKPLICNETRCIDCWNQEYKEGE